MRISNNQLCCQITGHFAVAPFDQHLSTLEGQELQGEFNTLFALGILPGSTLLLQVTAVLSTILVFRYEQKYIKCIRGL